MLTLRECYDALLNDLDRMPKHKAGTGWHIDRVRAYLRISAQLGLHPSAIAASK